MGWKAESLGQQLMLRFRWTLYGVGLTCLVLPWWIVTFRPHGRTELSAVLFPASFIVLPLMFRRENDMVGSVDAWESRASECSGGQARQAGSLSYGE